MENQEKPVNRIFQDLVNKKKKLSPFGNSLNHINPDV